MKPVYVCAFLLPLAAQSVATEPMAVPKIGHIEYYGLQKVSTQRIARALGLHVGDPLPPSKGDVEERLEKVPGVVQARVEAVCCQDKGNAILFVGIEEKGAPHFALRSPPSGNAVLPQDVVDSYHKLVSTLAAAGHRGSTDEDLTEGHALAADPDARELQQGFAEYDRDHLPLVRDVLRNSAEEDQRAMAATIIGYAADKTKVVPDLEYAMQDADETVRANAMRSLVAIAVLAVREPKLGIRISPTWFIEMLNSVVLSDRIKAATALVNLTEHEGKAILEQVRQRALGAVLEMAQWQYLRYALPAYILLGRMAGMSEQAIQETWSKGQRREVIMRFAGKR